MLRTKLPFFLAYARARQQPIFIEYIESDGNQYILDTLQIEPSHKIVIDGQYTYTGPSYKFVAGSAEKKWKNQACIRLHSETTALISAGVSSDLFSINSNQRYLWTLDILNGKGYLDNNEVSSFSGFVPSGSSRWGYIGVLFNDAFYNASVGKTYSIKLYDNEVLIRHLRPCLQGNTPCMYDMVTGKYFYNQGTGEFIAGGKMVNFDYTRVYAWISTDNRWHPASDSCSFLIPLTVGKQYRIVWQNANAEIDGIENTIFRYGQTNDSVPSGQLLNDCVRTSPQDTPVAEITAVNKYLVVQVRSRLGDLMAKYELFKVFEI